MIEVLFCCDHNLSKHLPPLINSIQLNSSDKNIKYTLLTFSELSEFDIPEKYNVKIIRCDRKEYEWLYMDGIRKAELTIECYLRLFAAEILNEIDRIIYLDVDIIAEGDIKKLWDIDLGKKFCAMSWQVDPKYFSIKDSDNEFQDGVILMDLEKMRKFNFAKKIRRQHDKNIRKKQYGFNYDQGLMTQVARKNTLALPFFYNFNDYVFGQLIINEDSFLLKGASGHKIKYLDDDEYLKEIIGEKNLKEIIFFHYAGKNKAWKKKYSRYYKYAE